jgi:hypothetical protein
MYIQAQNAMKRREMIANPSCAVQTMQQPDLGRLGRFVGPPIVTLGDVTASQLLANVVPGGTPVAAPATGAAAAPAPTASLFSNPMVLAGLAVFAVLLIMWSGKTRRKMRSARVKRAKRRARISSLESELELARAEG